MTDMNFCCPVTGKNEQLQIETTIKSRLSQEYEDAKNCTGPPAVQKRLIQCSGSEECKSVLPSDRCKHFNFA